MSTNEERAETRARTRTFGELRKAVLAKAHARDHFIFREISHEHDDYWDRLNAVEYERGYTSDYTKPGTPALWEMKLLTQQEFETWLSECP